MAVQWLEKNQTKIVTNQWGEDIYGLKATNVFGLAWNYYLAYTKFITGLDLTMDMGLKCEFFMAATYKIGYAPDTSFGVAKNNVSPICKNMYAGLESFVTTVQNIFGLRTAVVDVDNFAAEVRNADVGAEDIAGLTSVEEWAVSKLITSPTCLITCTEMAGFVVGANGVGVEPAGVTISGPMIELA